MMRFLCVIVALSGLLAVQCYLTLEEKTNLLAGVSASDRDWRIILIQNLKTNIVDPDGGMLSELGLLREGEGITPQKILERLVSRKSTTGTQKNFGIRTLGVALENQFVKTLMVHSYLAYGYAIHRDANLKAMRVCISKIQVALEIFISKLAFFDHSIQFLMDLNQTINLFLNTHKENWENLQMDVIKDFLSSIIKNTKSKVTLQEHDPLVFVQVIDQIKLVNVTKRELTNIFALGGHQLYSMTIKIDTYDHVDVHSMPLEFYDNVLKIIKYTASENPNISET